MREDSHYIVLELGEDLELSSSETREALLNWQDKLDFLDLHFTPDGKFAYLLSRHDSPAFFERTRVDLFQVGEGHRLNPVGKAHWLAGRVISSSVDPETGELIVFRKDTHGITATRVFAARDELAGKGEFR